MTPESPLQECQCGVKWQPWDTPTPDREKLNAHCHAFADMREANRKLTVALNTIYRSVCECSGPCTCSGTMMRIAGEALNA